MYVTHMRKFECVTITLTIPIFSTTLFSLHVQHPIQVSEPGKVLESFFFFGRPDEKRENEGGRISESSNNGSFVRSSPFGPLIRI